MRKGIGITNFQRAKKKNSFRLARPENDAYFFHGSRYQPSADLSIGGSAWLEDGVSPSRV